MPGRVVVKYCSGNAREAKLLEAARAAAVTTGRDIVGAERLTRCDFATAMARERCAGEPMALWWRD